MAAAGDLIAQIEDVGSELTSFLEGLSPEAFYREPEGENWSVAEIAGHVSEAPLTFARQAALLAAEPGRTVGRQLEDDERLQGVESLLSVTPAAAARTFQANLREAAAILRTIPDESWQVQGTHARFGPMSVQQLVETVILEHLRGHLEQAREAAAAALD
jgi:hypothetical protein